MAAPRIVDRQGGVCTPSNKLPRAEISDGFGFMVSVLARPKGTQEQFSHVCGGTLITPLHVLCAAHCLDLRNSEYCVSIGNLEWQQGRKILVQTGVAHPKYRDATEGYDIAIFTLSELIFDIEPVRLATGNAFLMSEYQAMAIGWGQTCSPGSLSSHLLKISLKVLKQQDYPPIVTPVTHYPGLLIAGAIDGGPDTCQGDSGGPLLYPYKSGWFQIGITSWGHGCGEHPGYYTFITTFKSWIEDICSTNTLFSVKDLNTGKAVFYLWDANAASLRCDELNRASGMNQWRRYDVVPIELKPKFTDFKKEDSGICVLF